MAVEQKVTINEKKRLTRLELGASGTYVVGGIISGIDHKSGLSGVQGLKVFDEMRKADASVKASLKVMKLPILSANWYIEPASEEEKDLGVADFIEQNLFNGMTITWRGFLRQALTHLDFGFAVFEKVFELREDGLIHWRKFAPRLQRSIYRWTTEGGENGVTQWLPDGRHISIPIEKLLIFTNDKEGDNWAGISEIRSAFQPYSSKDMLYKIDRIAHERQGVGIPYVKLPANADPSEVSEAESLVKNMYANEQAYLKYKEGWEFGFLDMKASATRQQDRSILHHDRQISKNVLAPFLDLGSGNTGSFALSQDQSRMFLLGLESIAQHIAETINLYAIPQLVDFNFSVEEYPKLKFNKVGDVDHEKITGSIQRAVLAGVITPDKGLEAHLRDIMNLPELDEANILVKEPAEGLRATDRIEQIMKMKERVDDAIEKIEKSA